MPPLDIPVLTTERLRLEPLGPAHSAGMFAMWSREEVCRHSGPADDADGQPIPLPATSPADSDRIVDFFARRAAAGLGLRWAMITAADGRFAGAIGFNNLTPCAELAYHQSPEFWGQGLMAEAARRVMAWAAETGAREAEAFIEPGNTSSIRLATGLGFRPTGESSGTAARYHRRLEG